MLSSFIAFIISCIIINNVNILKYKVDNLNLKSRFLEAERDNNDENATLKPNRIDADKRRKEKRNQIRDNNRLAHQIHSSPEYENLLNNSDDRWDDSDYGHERTLRYAVRATSFFDRYRVSEAHRHLNRSSEYQRNRRQLLTEVIFPNFSKSFEDAKFHSCASLNSNDDDNAACHEDLSHLAGTPKRLRAVNLFESNLSNICRVSDYRGVSDFVTTPEIQIATSTDGTTLNFLKNTVQAFGICFLIWNSIKNMIIGIKL